MANHFDDMRDILICYSEAEGNSAMFSANVQRLMGKNPNRKIHALCLLFDNLLNTQALLTTALNDANGNLNNEGSPEVTKEEAFTSLQMAITAMAANYQN